MGYIFHILQGSLIASVTIIQLPSGSELVWVKWTLEIWENQLVANHYKTQQLIYLWFNVTFMQHECNSSEPKCPIT